MSVHAYSTSVLQWGHTQTICQLLSTGCWELHDMKTHLSNNVSIIMRLWPQYGSRTINTEGDLKPSPLLRQRGWPSTWLNSASDLLPTQLQQWEREEGVNVRKTKNVCWWESLERQGETWGCLGGTGSIPSQRSSGQNETLKSAFEDLHFGSSLQCAEHLANLFKEKQITPEVKEHRGTLVKTFYVSLHHSLS